MRTQEEIVNKMRERYAEKRLLDFFPDVLIEMLEFEHAKEFLSEKYLDENPEGWEAVNPTDKMAIDQMREYMDFAWDKAHDERGISASRSVSKMKAWCWLLGCENDIDWSRYEPYGSPILRQICEKFGFEVKYG